MASRRIHHPAPRRRGWRAVGATVLCAGAALAVAGPAAADQVVFGTGFGDQKPTVFRAAAAQGGTPSTVVAVQSGHWATSSVVDATSGRVYWIDGYCDPNCSAAPRTYSIKYANLDGSGGVQDLAGSANLGVGTSGLSIDRARGRLYWVASGAGQVGQVKVGYTALDGSGSNPLITSPGTSSWTNLIVDPASGRAWWNDANNDVLTAPLEGGTPTSFPSPTQAGCGLSGANPVFYLGAVDAARERLYFFYYDADGSRLVSTDLTGANCQVVTTSPIPGEVSAYMAVDPDGGSAYLANFDAGPGADDGAVARQPLSAPFGREWVVPWTSSAYNDTGAALLVKAPRISGANPAVSPTGPVGAGQALACTVQWAADQPGLRVFQAPESTTISWQRDGTDIPGATGTTYAPTAPGTYTCAVQATNWAGTTRVVATGSATVPVPPAPAAAPSPAPTTAPTAAERAAEARTQALEACAVKSGTAKATCTAKANATYTRTIALERAHRARVSALAACNAKKGTAKATCTTRARATYTRSTALARASYARTTALAACNAKKGTAKATCTRTARAAYAASVAKAARAYANATRGR